MGLLATILNDSEARFRYSTQSQYVCLPFSEVRPQPVTTQFVPAGILMMGVPGRQANDTWLLVVIAAESFKRAISKSKVLVLKLGWRMIWVMVALICDASVVKRLWSPKRAVHRPGLAKLLPTERKLITLCNLMDIYF